MMMVGFNSNKNRKLSPEAHMAPGLGGRVFESFSLPGTLARGRHDSGGWGDLLPWMPVLL